MTVMYFVPTAADIADAKASNCPLATPRDSRDCEGSKCGSWNSAQNKPCEGYRGRIDYSVEAVMGRFNESKNSVKRS